MATTPAGGSANASKIIGEWHKIPSSKKTGVFYYYNEKTGNSTWKVPPVSIAKWYATT